MRLYIHIRASWHLYIILKTLWYRFSSNKHPEADGRLLRTALIEGRRLNERGSRSDELLTKFSKIIDVIFPTNEHNYHHYI